VKNIKFNLIEKYFFLIVTGANLIPILSGQFFPTLDGAAHLYNSQLINSLLWEKDSLLNAFFKFNEEPVPNWTGHAVLSVFNFFLAAFIAEKLLLLLYMIGLPLSFRGLINTISPRNKLFSYLIFPFTYSYVFFLGFYNFSISIVFLLITINYWMKQEYNPFKIQNILILFTLITLIYFSHIFVFGITIFLIALHILLKATNEIIANSNQIKEILINSFRKTGILLLSSFIPLLLFYFYFYSRPPSGNYTFLNHMELIDWLKNIRPIIALNFIVEEAYTKKLFYLIFSLTVIAIYIRTNEILSNIDFSIKTKFTLAIKNIFRVADFWLIASIIMLFLYFNLPDSDGYAGYVSIRLGLLFFIFYIIWLSTQKFPVWLGLLTTGVVLYCNFKLNSYYSTATKDLNNVAKECYKASDYILPNSIVLPINYSDHWLHGHFSNYLGIDKPMIILENYECATGYFPLKWNDASIPNTLLGNTSSHELSCLQWKSNNQNPTVIIDYVFVLGNIDAKSDACNIIIKQILSEKYTLTYSSDNCKLYQINNKYTSDTIM
jgi:hypothetical protein